MKELRLSFEDKEFKKIIKVKEISNLNWHNFIIFLVEKSAKENLIKSNRR